MPEEDIKMERTELLSPLSKGERILVALDGTIYSLRALDQAISMAKECNGTLFVISVVEANPEIPQVTSAFEEKRIEERREFLERVKSKVLKEGIECQTIVHVGTKPHEFILGEAEGKKTDLIVMGTHGRIGPKNSLPGSVAERVIGHAPCAVLVTPA